MCVCVLSIAMQSKSSTLISVPPWTWTCLKTTCMYVESYDKRLLSYAVKIKKKISYIMIVIIIIKINQWVSQWCHSHLSVGNEWCRKCVSTSLCLRWLIMFGCWSLNLLCLYQPYWVVYKHYSIIYNSIIIFHQFIICIFTIYLLIQGVNSLVN